MPLPNLSQYFSVFNDFQVLKSGHSITIFSTSSLDVDAYKIVLKLFIAGMPICLFRINSVFKFSPLKIKVWNSL